MKKFFMFLLAVVIMVNPILANAQLIESSLQQTVDAADINEGKYYPQSIFYLESTAIDTINNLDLLNNFVNNGGIIVVDNNDIALSLCQTLNMNIEPEFFFSSTKTNSESNVDIATLYYKFADGLDGIYTINAKNSISSLEKDNLISEAINEIHIEQRSYSNSGIQTLSTNDTGKTLGSLTVTTTCFPKGKIKATYTFFTVQDYNGHDYYTVKANIYGYPGATLYSSDSNYKSKFKGLSLNNSFETSTSSVSIDSYGPHRTIQSSSYTVSVGASFENITSATFDANFSYTKNIEDTSIEATSTTKLAQWEVSLSGDARKQSINFVPATTFVCPETKGNITISVSSDYVLDSWDTFKETISINRNVKCTPSSCSQI